MRVQTGWWASELRLHCSEAGRETRRGRHLERWETEGELCWGHEARRVEEKNKRKKLWQQQMPDKAPLPTLLIPVQVFEGERKSSKMRNQAAIKAYKGPFEVLSLK